ncbi:TonB-dependent receptor plug domain-containing protein [Sedimenticola hydrogenitrophicus]|uniref:TonB-dependent receptor plug domain-containing protein n=1 Tax=Sedimenticola hydrogenitrophicus TaxID=2967975 RepID=UPI0021A6372B|nr:TonB-dependent receptor [Sedimenticola hydrogenitrophicus]
MGLGAIASLSVQAMDANNPLTEELFFSDVPVVLSATRLKQALPDSPASVTVIDRTMIEVSGAIELVDLLRLVPGFQVGHYTGSKFTVSSHGNADRFARDMQVLVDGRSIYDPAFGGVTWSDQELDMDDIQRIEVIRGPNASTHGSNSFAGVINIVTQHPSEQPAIRVRTLVGDGGRRQIYNRFAGVENNLSYRVALKYDENDGFDTRHDSSDTRWLSIRSDYQINSRDALLLELGQSGGTREDGFPADAEQPFRATEDNHAFQQLRWTRSLAPGNEYSLQFYHNYQEIDDSFSDAVTFAPLDVSLGYGFKSQRYDLEFQHTFDINPAQRMVWGLGARRDQAKGVWTFKRGDWMTRDQYRAFANYEWRMTDSLLLNLGGMYEKFDQKEGFFSPMAALNLKLDEMNTLRLRATRAYRMPTFWEDFADQSVVLTGSMVPILQTYKTTTNLKPEYIESFELGYLGSFEKLGLTLDMKLFHEEIKEMIAEVADLNAPDQPFAYINSGSFNINGFEVGLRWDISARSMLHIAYSLTNAYGSQIKKDPPTLPEHYRILDRRVPPLTLSVLGSHQFDNGIKLSSAYYYMDDVDWAGDGDDIDINRRWDIKISKPFELERADGEIALIFQNIGPDNDFQDFHTENVWGERVFLQASLNWY